MNRSFKNKIIKILSLILVLLFTLETYAASYRIEEAAKNALNGWYIPCILEKEEQMHFKASAIKNLKKKVNVITIGSSHLQGVTTFDVEDDYVNLAIGGSTLKERLSILGLLEFYGIKYNRVIYEIDLPSTLYVIDENNKGFSYYEKYFLNILDKKENRKEEVDVNKDYKGANDIKWLDKYLFNDVPDYLFYYRPDISIGFANIIYNFPEGEKEKVKEVLLKDDSIYKNEKLSLDYKEITNKVFKYFKSKKVAVNLVLVPRPPYIYDSIGMNDFPILLELETFAHSLAFNNGFKITGSLNPYVINISDEDFYDGFHLYPEALSKYFDFK